MREKLFMNSCLMIMWFGACTHCCAYGEKGCEVKPYGRQSAIGSSIFTSPVMGRNRIFSPPGTNGGKSLESKPRMSGVSVSSGPTWWVNPGPP